MCMHVRACVSGRKINWVVIMQYKALCLNHEGRSSRVIVDDSLTLPN